MIIGEIHNTSLTLVNLYAPNIDSPSFFQKVFALIPDISQTNWVRGGDFNTTLHPYLDRSSTRIIPKSNSSEFLNTFLKNSNILDIWWSMNPSGRDYSFYSSVHNSYSRIDYFLVDAKLMPFTTNTKYHNIGISDHSPLTFSLYLEDITTSRRFWRLNPQLQTESNFCEYLKTQIKQYF